MENGVAYKKKCVHQMRLYIVVYSLFVEGPQQQNYKVVNTIFNVIVLVLSVVLCGNQIDSNNRTLKSNLNGQWIENRRDVII